MTAKGLFIMNIKKDIFNLMLLKKRISKKEACNQLGFSVNTVNNWLHKNIRTPVAKAMYIAEYFGVELDYMFN